MYILYLFCIYIYICNVNTPSSFCQRSLVQMVRGTATTWVVQLQKHCTHRGAWLVAVQFHALPSTDPNNQWPLSFGPKFCPDFYVGFHVGSRPSKRAMCLQWKCSWSLEQMLQKKARMSKITPKLALPVGTQHWSILVVHWVDVPGTGIE